MEKESSTWAMSIFSTICWLQRTGDLTRIVTLCLRAYARSSANEKKNHGIQRRHGKHSHDMRSNMWVSRNRGSPRPFVSWISPLDPHGNPQIGAWSIMESMGELLGSALRHRGWLDRNSDGLTQMSSMAISVSPLNLSTHGWRDCLLDSHGGF